MTLFKRCSATVATLLLAGFASFAHAKTERKVEMVCPYDDSVFTATLEMSGYTNGTTLDLKPVGSIISPWPLAVCPTNGFVYYQPHFTDEELATLKPFVFSDDYKAMRDESPYYRAAWLKEHAGFSHGDVTMTLLMASWERHAYVTKVAERLPQDIAESTGEIKTTWVLLYGDLLRQLGRFPEAEQVFSNLQKELERFSPFDTVARFELTLVQAKDTSNQHLIAEASKAIENDPAYQQASKTAVLKQAGPLRQARVLEPENLNPRPKSNRIFWSDDAKTLYANSSGGILAIDVATGTLASSPKLACPGCDFAISELLLANGNSLWVYNSVGGNVGARSSKPGSLKMLDAKTFEPTASYEVRDLESPALLSYDKSALIYKKFASEFEQHDLSGKDVKPLALPSGQTLAVGRQFGSSIKAIDPTGSRLAMLLGGMDKDRMVIWDYAAGEQVKELDTASQNKHLPNAEASFSVDGKSLYLTNTIAIDIDKAKGGKCEISQWDTKTGSMLASQQMPGEHSLVAVSADKRYVALACDQSVSLWTANLSQRVAMITIGGKGAFLAIAFSPDSKKLAVHAGKTLAIYDVVN